MEYTKELWGQIQGHYMTNFRGRPAQNLITTFPKVSILIIYLGKAHSQPIIFIVEKRLLGDMGLKPGLAHQGLIKQFMCIKVINPHGMRSRFKCLTNRARQKGTFVPALHVFLVFV